MLLEFEFPDAGDDVEAGVVLEDDDSVEIELVVVDVCRVEDVDGDEEGVGLDNDVELSEFLINSAPLSKDSLPNTTSKWKPFAMVRLCSVWGIQL